MFSACGAGEKLLHLSKVQPKEILGHAGRCTLRKLQLALSICSFAKNKASQGWGEGKKSFIFMKDSCPFFIPSHAIVLSRCGFSFPLSSRHDIPLPTLHLGLGFPCLLPSNQGLDLPFRECVFRGRGLIQGQKIVGLDGN